MAERTLESLNRGRHIYKQIWWPLVGEILTLEWEEGNNHDKFAVSLLKDATVFWHVPREFSLVFWHFLRHGETITCKVVLIEESVVKLLRSASSLSLHTTTDNI